MKRLLPGIFLLLTAFVLFTGYSDEEAIAKKKAADDFRKSYVATSITKPEQLGWTGKNCKAGKLSHDMYVNAITRINYFRRLAGVNDEIVLDSSWCHLAQAAAVIMNANNELNHHPTAMMKCYSKDGALGASTSNLSSIVEKSIEMIISDEIQDGGTFNTDCGHRRWLLFSRANKMGFGATPGAYAVKVFSSSTDGEQDTSSFHGKVPEYFGYPFQGYMPFQLVYPKWSFAVPGGNFSKATVEVKAGEKLIGCSVISRGTVNYGDPTMIFTIRGLKEDFEYNYYNMGDKKKDFDTKGLLNKKITVKVSNVNVSGKMKSYTYSFTIFDPDEVQ